MGTFLIFQGSESHTNLVGTTTAANLQEAQKLVASKLSRTFESVEIDSELNIILFTAYFPKNQEQKDVHQLDLTSPTFARELNEQGANYVWSTVYYTVKNATDYEF